MFDLVVELTGGGPGSTTELTSINLKKKHLKNGELTQFSICRNHVCHNFRFRQYLGKSDE